jgi:hypothetical protein
MNWLIGISIFVVGYLVIHFTFNFLVKRNILKEDK